MAPARLDIYARGYVLRLLECLRAEFPILLALVGDQVFEMFASSYVWSAVAVLIAVRAWRGIFGLSAVDAARFRRRAGRDRGDPRQSSRAGARPRRSLSGVRPQTIPRITPPMRSP